MFLNKATTSLRREYVLNLLYPSNCPAGLFYITTNWMFQYFYLIKLKKIVGETVYMWIQLLFLYIMVFRGGFWENGRIGSTKNLSPQPDNDYNGGIGLMELFWNPGV